jgi:hypothetical protein
MISTPIEAKEKITKNKNHNDPYIDRHTTVTPYVSGISKGILQRECSQSSSQSQTQGGHQIAHQ